MTLLVEIECHGPRYVAGLTHRQVIVRGLQRLGGMAHGWMQVHPVPRHPDWGAPCQVVLAAGGALVPDLSPPELLRALEEQYATDLPEFEVHLYPAIDPALVLDPNKPVPERRPLALGAGELHHLLNPLEN